MSDPDASSRAVMFDWLRFETVSELHQHVRAPGEVFRAVILVRDRLGLPFQAALMYAVEQGAVIPISAGSAIADVARFNELVRSLPPGVVTVEARPKA
jgi:hypothetical protein